MNLKRYLSIALVCFALPFLVGCPSTNQGTVTPDNTPSFSQKTLQFLGQSAVAMRDQLNTQEGQDFDVAILTYGFQFGFAVGDLASNLAGGGDLLSAESKRQIGSEMWAWSVMWYSLADGNLTTDKFNGAAGVFAPSWNATKYQAFFGGFNSAMKSQIVKLQNAAAKETDPAEKAKWVLALKNLSVVGARTAQNLAKVWDPAGEPDI